jgi:hypothetical protein
MRRSKEYGDINIKLSHVLALYGGVVSFSISRYHMGQ